jgi:hypothetical protein
MMMMMKVRSRRGARADRWTSPRPLTPNQVSAYRGGSHKKMELKALTNWYALEMAASAKTHLIFRFGLCHTSRMYCKSPQV